MSVCIMCRMSFRNIQNLLNLRLSEHDSRHYRISTKQIVIFHFECAAFVSGFLLKICIVQIVCQHNTEMEMKIHDEKNTQHVVNWNEQWEQKENKFQEIFRWSNTFLCDWLVILEEDTITMNPTKHSVY